MPSVRRGHAHQQSLNLPAHKFRTVLGIAPRPRDQDDTTSDSDTAPPPPFSLIRRSVDLVGSYASHKKPKHPPGRTSVADASFFEPISTVIIDTTPPPPATMPTKESPADARQSRPARRPVLRMDAQDGPWSVSVAENPGDPTSYSLYVKTPTHNLTLSRTAHEIVDLHHKLHDSYPSVKLPALPIDTNTLPQPAKRKSAFLNTLSRLASPASKSAAGRHASKPSLSNSPRSGAPSTLGTPVGSPGHEVLDPFSSFGDETPLTSPTASTNPLLTGLAAYLTTISNDQLLRQARAWKRFVRVRTDDLESVRVERAIKRVRSDLAAHMTSPSTVDVQLLSSSVAPSVNGDAEENSVETADGVLADKPALGRRDSRFHEHIEKKQARDELEPAAEEGTEELAPANGDQGAAEEQPETPRSPKKPLEDAATESETASVATNGVDDDEKTPSTPVAGDTVASRIPRSQSADPDKAARLSRMFGGSSTNGTGSPQSASASQTEDDASIGTSHAARKKRSKSADPKRQLAQRKVTVSDFEMLRVLGKGCAGKVLLVRYRASGDLYALKAITKRHVLAHQELQHTLTEQAVLKRMAAEGADPFVVKLWWSFHDKENLFLVMDFHPGGDLATQLARWGRLGRDRARFYAAEIVEGVEGLHNAGVIYRDLKPENILIAADGHIVLTDFGLSKEFPRRSAAITAPSTPNGQRSGFQTSQTPPASPYWMGEDHSPDLAQQWPSRGTDTTSTFCGTAEYLAPEVIQGLPYSYEVDWWSFGTMLYEMLTGITPFWADNHSDMYVRVLQDELQFPDDRAMDQDTKSLIRGLLQRNPALRISEPRIKRHPYFSMIDWSHVYYKRYIPPYIPPIDPQNASDTQNFDDTFLDMEPVINDENDAMDTDGERDQTDTDRTDGEDSVTTPSQSRSSSIHPAIEDDSVDVFDGYSFKGRHSVILDEDAESGSSESEEDEDSGARSILAELNGEDAAAKKAAADAVAASEEQTPEPKTPEARPAGLPETPKEEEEAAEPAKAEATKPAVKIDTSARAKADKPAPPALKSPVEAAAAAAAALTIAEEKRKDPKKTTVTTKAPNRVARPTRNRREKSGVPALDRDLSDANDEDEAPTEREEEDDDWDFIEAAGEDRNGAKGNSLFARGVVDRYKLAVFRKGSTPNRSVSGMSQASDLPASEAGSPVPSDKQRRGRTPGLPFRKNPKQFLRPKSPPPSSQSSRTTKTLNHSTSATLSTASSLHPPSSQFGRGTASTMSPSLSLKSKESATSIGSPNSSSDTSMNDGERDGDVVETVRAPAAGLEDADKQKNKKLRKYKEGAEKVLSLFSSPR